MGTWGITAFENDWAVEWIDSLDQPIGAEAIGRELEYVNSREPNHGCAESAARTLAACELIAMFRGYPIENDPVGVLEFSTDASDLTSLGVGTKACKAILYVQSRSELAELWKEVERFEEWSVYLSDLIDRLQRPPRAIKKVSSRVRKPQPKLGDVIEVALDSGIGYMQFVGNTEDANVVRIYPERVSVPLDQSQLKDSFDSNEPVDYQLVRTDVAGVLDLGYLVVAHCSNFYRLNEPIWMRLRALVSPENPDGWKLVTDGQETLTGREFSTVFPSVIQAHLASWSISFPETAVISLREQWD
jgi:hypothetical protein